MSSSATSTYHSCDAECRGVRQSLQSGSTPCEHALSWTKSKSYLWPPPLQPSIADPPASHPPGRSDFASCILTNCNLTTAHVYAEIMAPTGCIAPAAVDVTDAFLAVVAFCSFTACSTVLCSSLYARLAHDTCHPLDNPVRISTRIFVAERVRL